MLGAREETVAVQCRVSKATAARLKEIADREYRPVAAEMRRLIEAHVEAVDEREAA
jgi:predicted DNA-binding protein